MIQPSSVVQSVVTERETQRLLRLLDERVLVVEDDPDFEPIFRRALRYVDPDLRMLWASSAREAIYLLQSRPITFVVADYMLDDAPGSYVQRALERMAPKVPFAMISAWPLSAELERPGGARIPFLPKPFSPEALIKFLTRLHRTRH